MPSGSVSRPTRMPCRLPSAGGERGREAASQRQPREAPGGERLGGAAAGPKTKQVPGTLQPLANASRCANASGCARTRAAVGDVAPEVVGLNLPQPRKPLQHADLKLARVHAVVGLDERVACGRGDGTHRVGNMLPTTCAAHAACWPAAAQYVTEPVMWIQQPEEAVQR